MTPHTPKTIMLKTNTSGMGFSGPILQKKHTHTHFSIRPCQGLSSPNAFVRCRISIRHARAHFARRLNSVAYASFRRFQPNLLPDGPSTPSIVPHSTPDTSPRCRSQPP